MVTVVVNIRRGKVEQDLEDRLAKKLMVSDIGHLFTY
jgi:hypothetical protein